MRVAQVLSEFVSNALKLTGGEEARKTVRFTLMVDKFFDSLNVNRFISGKHRRKPFQDPYRSAKDFHLQVREHDMYLCIITQHFGSG